MLLRALPFLLFLASCNQLVKMADDSYYEKVDAKSGADHLKIVFSHNINGETHPCGCRKFPLGGLPQAAGYLHEASKNSPVLYVDTGDMLFPSSNIPESLKTSVKYTADKLVEAQAMQGLKFFVPGDQDFAMGENYLAEVSRKKKFSFLVTNMKDNSPIKHKKMSAVKVGGREILFLGIIHPEAAPSARNLLESPIKALEKALENVKTKSSEAVIVVLSHSGMDFDKSLARSFPQIDWIIGSHSQNFLKSPEQIGNVKIVQALSRNHYLGEIKIPFNSKKKETYQLVAMSENMDKKLADNPMTAWLADYKSKLDEIQKNEQMRFMAESLPEGQRLKTYISCSECHKEQTDFWQGTAHSVAWQTLEKAGASNNPQCIECHSLGFQKAGGFATTAGIIQGDGVNEKKIQEYMAEVKQVFKGTGSVRELAAKKRRELSDKWMKIDANHGVEANFANVQCLHCHNQNPDHPFDIGDSPKKAEMENNCLSCHTADQSPEWYNKGDNGLATTPNKKYVADKIKEIACPAM